MARMEDKLRAWAQVSDINPEPLGAASLAQVHRARRRSDGAELVIKIQYPGVAEAIDSDLGETGQRGLEDFIFAGTTGHAFLGDNSTRIYF